MSGHLGLAGFPEFGRGSGAVGRCLSGFLLLGLLLGGCSSGGRSLSSGGEPLSGGVLLAVLPLENISERTDAGDVTSRIVTQRMSERHGWTVVPPAEVDAALEEMRIRDSGALVGSALAEFGRRVHARYLLTGTVLESATVRTADGDVPSVGLSLKLMEAPTARVLWTRMKFRTGDDHETLFGWGRVYSAQKLTADLVADLLHDMPGPPADTAASGGGESR